MVNIRPLRAGIVGFGVIGQATASVFDEVVAYDPPKGLGALTDLRDTDVVFVCVPTPTDEHKQDLRTLETSMDALANELPNGHLVFVRSTVLPGTTRQLQRQFPSLLLVHNPEFLRSHRAEEDARHPRRIVLGTDADCAARRNRIESVYLRSKVEEAGERIAVVSTVTAELVKYFANCFLAMKVSYFNEVHEICADLSCDSFRVRELLGKDERIGRGVESEVILDRPGLWDECLPKDLAAFRGFLVERGLPGTLFEATGNVDERVKRRVLAALTQRLVVSQSASCAE